MRLTIINRNVLPRKSLGQPCPPNQFRPAPGMPCRGAVGTMPGGMDVPTLPGQQPSAPAGNGAVPVCNIPPGYGGTPSGGVAFGYQVQACPDGQGTFTVYGAQDGRVVATGVTADCLAQFGDVTMADPDSSVCAPPEPATGSDCNIAPAFAGKPVLKCPPGNGAGTSYFVDLETGMLAGNNPGPGCSDPNIVEIASAGDPRCRGGMGFAVPGGVPPGAGAAPAPGAQPVGGAPAAGAPGAIVPGGQAPGQVPGQGGRQPGTLPTQGLQPGGLPGGSPWPSYGSPIGVSPSRAPGTMPTQPIQSPAFRPPISVPCSTAPKPLEKWVESCPGVRQARGY